MRETGIAAAVRPSARRQPDTPRDAPRDPGRVPKTSLGFVAVLLAVLAAACGTDGGPSPRRGIDIYAANCVSCHGDVSTGEGAVDGAPIHSPAGHTWHHSDGQLADIILGRNPYPGRTMPVFAGALSDQEVRNVVAYLKTGWEPRQLEVQKGISGQ